MAYLPEPVMNLQVAVEMLNSLQPLKNEEYEFRAKRAFNEARKAYNASPKNLTSIVIYASSLTIIGKIKEALNVFEKEAFPRFKQVKKLKRVTEQEKIYYETYIKRNYAYTLLLNGNFEKALEIITEAIKLPRKGLDFDFLRVQIEIYFFNSLYEDCIHFSAPTKLFLILNSNPEIIKNYFVPNLVYCAFSYYCLNDYKNCLSVIKEITNVMDIKNPEELYNVIENSLVCNAFKSEMLEKEKMIFNEVKNLYSFYSNSKENIFFSKEITYKTKNYIINIEKLPDDWYYGEVESIKNIRSQAKSIQELENSIKQYLDLYSVDSKIFFIPSKKALKKIRIEENASDTNKNLEEESQEWLKEDFNDNLSKYDIPEYKNFTLI